jgi:hypothetical protein
MSHEQGVDAELDRPSGQPFDDYLRQANRLCDDSLAALKDQLALPRAIDALFMDFLLDIGRAMPATAGVLLLNAHCTTRAAAGLAMSGQLLTVFMALRGSIESALYANAMVVQPNLEPIWLQRDRSVEARRACRDQFSAAKVFKLLAAAHDEEFADRARDAYEATIDFGAHPNSRSLLQSIHIEELQSGDYSLRFAYLHSVDSFEVRQALVAWAETVLIVMYISFIACQRHPRMKQINAQALDLQSQLPSFVESLGLGSAT